MVSVKSAVVAALAISPLSEAANTVNELVVKATGGNVSSPIMYGLMHEDINNSGDGGIYAELISNRAFQGSPRFPSNLDGWSPVGGAQLALKNLSQPLSAALPTSVQVSGEKGMIGLANSGYWGIDVKKQKYTGSFYVKGEYEGKFTVSLQSALGDKEVFGKVEVESQSVAGEWTQHNFTLVPRKNAPNSNNTFALTFKAEKAKNRSLDFNLISLFPPTFNNRPNGLRPDLVEAFAALKPKFLRFPGGNMLMGNTIDSYWKWHLTLGPLKDRPGMAGTWSYQLTNGMGLIEYMQWADDLKLEPILGVWAGLSLDGAFYDPNQTAEAVQYALDEIEFLTGDAKRTKWGAVRAALGYPKPWRIRYVEIGNEDWLAGAPASYEAYKNYRFPMFYKAFQERYPDIQIIASPSVFDNMTIPAGAAGDWHPYLTPDNMVDSWDRLDPLTRDNLTIVGEAAVTHPNGGLGWNGPLGSNPWWIGSVAEGIFLLGVERNGDKVIGVTYAPLLRNLNRWQWGMTLVQHAADTKLTTRSTSWYVWKLLGEKPLKNTLPVTINKGGINPLYWVAGESDKGTSLFKAAVYNTTEPVSVSVRFEGQEKKGAKATLTVLTGPEDPYGFNDPFTGVNVVKEMKKTLKAEAGGVYKFSLPRWSVAVLETEKRHK
ncbi:glycoside hydrolase family 51 protein [Canariomyces notabilis]|uniref:non-reducing end alpha-L-arabinofuranosidase n=1 Tax=Canariomyces notabilis TaxID=2074819 RepID=A0AAN6QFF1_9PEZI|nr:glycoside hydrolase family 51 protein [Canariomyces arenarius]